ncbi:carbohydrate ABC transporter permease [Candidatus Haliotispira prima]|uniref:sn-glycerol-3-phosphate transport system permease protein UgpE n=1 Tax=Candidatus Haliotispira prima TaxID=3034016 RepID=A0ABY8MKU6_9SPIO|nr:carbohydrate ABC transporter permease [Candidatus Haliotispira prima]
MLPQALRAQKKRDALAVHITLATVSILLGLPVVFLVLKATQSTAEAITPSLLPGGMFWQNVQSAWKSYNMATFMGNTLVITTAITFGKTVLSILAAMVFVYFRIRGKLVLFWAILITLYIPTDLIAIGLFDVISQGQPSVPEFLVWLANPVKVLFRPIPFGLDWANSYKAIIIPFLASATGTFLFIQHFRTIPKSFAEVAVLEGMGPLSYLFRILIPVSRNTIGALWVIQFVFYWNQYFWPRLIIQDSDSQVIQVALRLMVGQDQIAWGVLMAGTIIVVLPPLLVFLLLIKQLEGGVALSTGK